MARDISQHAKGTVDRQLVELFERETGRGIEKLEAHSGLDVIVGIPLVDEGHLLEEVVKTVTMGLEQSGLADRAAILVVGSAGGEAELGAIADPEGSPPLCGFLLDRELQGRGWSIRALLEAASRKGSAPPEPRTPRSC